MVIDNRAGGTRAVANADPDGYTLLFASTTSLSIGPALFKNDGPGLAKRTARASAARMTEANCSLDLSV